MAERTFVLRLELENGQVVLKGLDDIGDKGDAAGKKVRDAFEKEATPSARAFEAAVEEGGRALDNYASRLGPFGSILRSLGPAGLIAAAGIGAIGFAAVKVGQASIEAIGRLDDLGDAAQRLNVGVDFLTQWGLALELAGGQQDDFVSGLQGFQEKIGAFLSGAGGKGVDKALDAIGITPSQLRAAGDLQAQLLLIADAIAKVDNATEQAGIADKLGLSFMLPLLRQGSDGMQELAAQTADLGTQTAEAAAKAGPLADQLKLINTNIRASADGLLVDLGPAVVDFMKTIEGGMPLLSKFARLMAWVGQGLGGSVLNTMGGFGGVSALIEMAQNDNGGAIATVQKSAVQGVLGGLINLRPKPPGTLNVTTPELDFGDLKNQVRWNLQDYSDSARAGSAADRKAEAAAAREQAEMTRAVTAALTDEQTIRLKLKETLEALNKAESAGFKLNGETVDYAKLRANAIKEASDAIAKLPQYSGFSGLASDLDAGAASAEKFTDHLGDAALAAEGAQQGMGILGDAIRGQIKDFDDLGESILNVIANLVEMAGMQSLKPGGGSFWGNLAAAFGFGSSGSGGSFGGFGGAGSGGGGVGAALGTFGGGKDSGGRTQAGMIYEWQEGHREFFTSNRDGQVFNPSKMGGAGGTQLIIKPTLVNNTGMQVDTETKATQNADGSVSLETILNRKITSRNSEDLASGRQDKALQSRTGIAPLLKRRA